MPAIDKKPDGAINWIGGGFGGVYAALRLDKTLARRADVEVTLVSSDNFLLFTPMLHEVASGDLNPSDIVNPIRRMLKRVRFVQAEVRSIDLAGWRRRPVWRSRGCWR